MRVLDSQKGTAAKVRVLIEWSDHRKSWSTVGVSDNVIEASWNALVDAIRLELMRLTETGQFGREGRRRLLLGRMRLRLLMRAVLCQQDIRTEPRLSRSDLPQPAGRYTRTRPT